jgi:hypothetical protein
MKILCAFLMEGQKLLRETQLKSTWTRYFREPKDNRARNEAIKTTLLCTNLTRFISIIEKGRRVKLKKRRGMRIVRTR